MQSVLANQSWAVPTDPPHRSQPLGPFPAALCALGPSVSLVALISLSLLEPLSLFLSRSMSLSLASPLPLIGRRPQEGFLLQSSGLCAIASRWGRPCPPGSPCQSPAGDLRLAFPVQVWGPWLLCALHCPEAWQGLLARSRQAGPRPAASVFPPEMWASLGLVSSHHLPATGRCLSFYQ